MKCYEIENAKFPCQGSGEARTQGLHVTTIIHSLAETLGTNYRGKGFNDKYLTMEMGFCWERALEIAYLDRMPSRIGEVVKDGIIMSPDGVGPDPDNDVEGVNLEEYKLTWKSTKSHPQENWNYMTQIKCYLYGVGLNRCIMRIIYLMGDYKGSGPIYKKYVFEFGDYELEENWQMILNHKSRMEQKGEI